MSVARFRFYAELNDFLEPEQRMIGFDHVFHRRASVKDMIEAIGVPHTEIDLILANSRSVGFSYIVNDGDQISVYPVFESLDISPLVKLRPQPLRSIRFVADGHLGRLARYLRLLGFDTHYDKQIDDAALAQISATEHRILLTCDRGLLKRKIVTHACFIRERDPWKQLTALVARLDLYRLVKPFERCMECNGLLAPIDKQAIEVHLDPNTRRYFDRFNRCTGCDRIYWEGSHYQRMQKLVQDLLARRDDTAPTNKVP